MIELYDIGRVITRPFREGYQFIAERGERYISDIDALSRIRAFHADRNLEISQEDFDLLSYVWVNAIKSGELYINPKKLVYPDVKPRFDKVRVAGHNVVLHTSGSKELVDILLNGECEYDEILLSSETGDKNSAETFARLWEYKEGRILAFYDDKPSVLHAAHNGFRMAGGQSRLYLVDRTGIISESKVKELEGKGVIKISSFDELE